jgi:hypothetical protein
MHNNTAHAWSRGAVVLLGVSAVLLVFVHGRLYPYAYDDAYIHFRIAAHLAETGQPYFNLNQPVSTSSSSMWTVFLSLIVLCGRMARLTVELPPVVAILNALFTFAGALAYTRLALHLAQRAQKALPAAFYAGFFVLYLALTLQPSIGLMETPATLLLVCIGLHLYLRRNPYCLALFAVAVFMRWEMALVCGLVMALALLRRDFRYRQLVLYPAAGALPGIIYNAAFFHTLFPNTIAAKSAVYSLTPLDTWQAILGGLAPRMALPALINDLYLLMLCAVLVLAVIFGMRSFLKTRCAAEGISVLIAVWAVALIAAYVARGVLLFPWYIPLFGAPLILSFARMASHPKLRLAAGVVCLPILLFQGVGLGRVILAATVNVGYYPEFATGARVRRYIETGTLLARLYPHATLLTSEIGGLGYGFGGTIADAAGLATPAALPYHPLKVPQERSDGSIGAIPAAFVEQTQPELIVSYDMFAEALLRSPILDQYVRTEYPLFLEDDLQRPGPKTLWQAHHFYVFVRKDVARLQALPAP